MKNKSLLKVLIITTFIVLSSFKNVTNLNPSSSKIQNLCNKNWIVVGATITPGILDTTGQLKTEFYSTMENCRKDNIYTYNENGNYADYEGAEKCNDKDNQIKKGTWKFYDKQNTLILDDSIKLEILQLDQSILKTKMIQFSFDVERTIIITYKSK